MTKDFFNRYAKMLTYVALFAIVFTASAAFASGENVFSTVTGRLTTTFQNVRSIIFIVGGFGLIGLGFAAIFGKIKWTWLAALAAGLAIVALAGAVVDYVTRQDGGSNVNFVDHSGSEFGDTLTNSGG